MNKPAFLITIDTEGDNLWSNHKKITTENSAYLPRFQSLCEKYGFKPTWLTNYEMATDSAYVEFANDVITRGVGEIGMHLHAWNSPPEYQLTDDDWKHQPYLIEYPENIIKSKIGFMTDLLENTFQVKMRSHRAGRWAFNEYYAQTLIEFGYQVDCSVTPRVNWMFNKGNPAGTGGSNYTNFPQNAYFLDPENISQPGQSPLLEIPMSTDYKHSALITALKQKIDAIRGKKRSPSVYWLRPARNNLNDMLRVVDRNLSAGQDYVEFMLHSSEFMPGGSPTFQSKSSIDALYDDLTALFETIHHRFSGKTLVEYYNDFGKSR
ncbi:polysaccharide deacetylase family protein [Tatumella sp. UCD-D_suzukii]|uniref:polysaccharide deacetylase family protein n=1 Tax=Tatumella sp. UCD-D_suzukii TaxID=1408192 RepID=UPI00046EFBCB|nr:polysaccharide deacetylase family protein [Tatumella sp. UCD-D_suzukii]